MTIIERDKAIEVLTLDLDNEIFAVEATHVREILDLIPVTQVPNDRPFLSGLINVRGKIVPLADLRPRLGMDARPPSKDSRIIVMEIMLGGEPVTVGIRADKVHEVTEIAAADLQEAPKIGLRWHTDFIRGIGKRGADFIAVLDIAAVLATGLQEPVGPGPVAHSTPL